MAIIDLFVRMWKDPFSHAIFLLCAGLFPSFIGFVLVVLGHRDGDKGGSARKLGLWLLAIGIVILAAQILYRVAELKTGVS